VIFHPYRCIFFHIGKAAGYSVERTFDPRYRDVLVPNYETFFGFDDSIHAYLQHATPAMMRDHIDAEIFDRYFKFSVVRNPFSRLISVYNYNRNLANRHGSFEAFVLALKTAYDVDNQYSSGHPTAQYCYTQIDGEDVCDLVLHVEKLPKAFKAVQRATNLRRDLIHANKSHGLDWDRKPTHQSYSHEMRIALLEVYQKDFELFGYNESPKKLKPIRRWLWPR